VLDVPYIKPGVIFKSLGFLGHPNHVLGDNTDCWSKESGRWRRLKLNTSGRYAAYGLCRHGVQMPHLLHRLMLLTFVGPCPEGMECRHLDGDPWNNCLANLRWGTRKENGEDKVRHGTSLVGTKNGNVRLNEDSVRDIRRLRRLGYRYRDIAKLHDVDFSTVAQIVLRKTWKHVA
jgi:hypothetical protein